jgi:hypothetical protein
MKNQKGIAPVLVIAFLFGITLVVAMAVYVIKNNQQAFFPTSPQAQVSPGSATSVGTQSGAGTNPVTPNPGTSGTGTADGEKSMAERFLDMVGEKIKSIITPKPPIGNLTPVRDLKGTWVSSIKGKGIQTYGQFNANGGTAQTYQEGDAVMVINSMKDNMASGTFQYINLCTWGKATIPKVGSASIPKKCVSTEAMPIQIRVSGTRLDFGTGSVGGSDISMQGNYTTDLISGSVTTTVPPYGVVKGEFHLMRKQN